MIHDDKTDVHAAIDCDTFVVNIHRPCARARWRAVLATPLVVFFRSLKCSLIYVERAESTLRFHAASQKFSQCTTE